MNYIRPLPFYLNKFSDYLQSKVEYSVLLSCVFLCSSVSISEFDFAKLTLFRFID